MSEDWPVRQRRRRRRSRHRTPLERLGDRLRVVVGGRRRGVIVALTVVLVGAAWIGWTLWSTSRALGEVATRAEVMRAALVRGDADVARRAMGEYQDAAETAESRTGGITWSALEFTPVFGDDLSGIEVVAGVLADIGRDGLPPLTNAAEEVSGEAFRPVGHRFPVGAIERLAQPAQQSESAFDRAEQTLAGVDSSSFVGPVRKRYDELQDLVTTARSTLGSTYRAARLIPELIGADRPRHLLLVLQNNAEARSSGGLPGALTLIRADRGRVKVVEQADAADLGRTAEPILPLSDEEIDVFGDILGRYPVDATLTPDFSRAADLLRVRWEAVRGGHVDGVVFVDPVAVSYLLSGTGPVVVPGYLPVATGTVVAAVENQIYRLTEDREVHSAYQQAVAKAVFDAFADGNGDSVGVLTGLVRGVQEGRVRLQLVDPDEQAEIDGTEIAGEFSTEKGPDPEIGIYLNDAGPTKMQFYLKYDARVFARSCAAGRQDFKGEINFHADTPADVDRLPPAITGATYPGVRVDPGSQLIVLFITAPIGGEVGAFELDGQPMPDPDVTTFAGRDLVRFALSFTPQQRHRLEFTMKGAKGQDGDLRLRVSPGAQPMSSNATVRSACEVR